MRLRNWRVMRLSMVLYRDHLSYQYYAADDDILAAWLISINNANSGGI